MPAMREAFDKEWSPRPQHDSLDMAVSLTWFKKGWSAREVAAQQVAEADAPVCPFCGSDHSGQFCPLAGEEKP